MDDTVECRKAASRIVEEIKEAFDEVMLPAIAADRIGALGEKSAKEISERKRVDVRVPRMLDRSGKGGPGHPGWRNVTLFDHSSSVAMLAASWAALDILANGDPEDDARSCAAVAFADGMLHDIDKSEQVDWNEVDGDLVAVYFKRYRVADFLARFGVHLTAGQFAVLIATTENRSSHSITGYTPPNRFIQVVRRYVKFADKLDGEWLKGTPTTAVQQVVRSWNAAIRHRNIFVSSGLPATRALVMSDPHHPMLLEAFGRSLAAECDAMTGLPPTFQTVCDETLLSILPVAEFDTLTEGAARDVAEGLLFEFEIVVSPMGLPKVAGARPTWVGVRETIAKGLATGLMDVRRLLSVSLGSLEDSGLRQALVELAAAAWVPVAPAPKKVSGKTLVFAAVPEAHSDGFEALVDAAVVSFAIGVLEDTGDKTFTRAAREEKLIARLGDMVPPVVLNCSDALTRRVGLALATAAKGRADPEFWTSLLGAKGIFAEWFAPTAVFGSMVDKAAPVREAVYHRLLALAQGKLIDSADAEYGCFITGEPVDSKPIDKTDRLYGIRSSAFSNRRGTPEAKFNENAATRLSPASYAEFRLRTQLNAAAGLPPGGIPVRICSPTSSGLASLSIANLPTTEFSMVDMVRQDPGKRHFTGMESFRGRTHLGRFESLPQHFADRSEGGKVTWGRVTFLKVAMQAARRYGRAVHVFAGLAIPRSEFFYCDCLDPELRMLLGGDGFRVEELPDAISRLELVGGIAAPTAADGLAMAAVAKEFCVPATRLPAACLAWSKATEMTSDGKQYRSDLASRLTHFINQEISEMDNNGSTSPVIKLGRLAAAIQQRPRFDEGANAEGFLFRLALDEVALATSRGISDRDSLLAAVHGTITVEGERRADGAKGFFSAKANRKAGQTIDEAIAGFAACFVDDYWFGLCRGRTPSARIVRSDLATYRHVFTHSKTTAAA